MSLLTNAMQLKIATAILTSASPLLITAMQEVVVILRNAAAASANPWDDILVEILDSIITGLAESKR